MKSATLPSFWTAYGSLDEDTKRQARKAYRLWAENPFHPSLHFKCINREENVWAELGQEPPTAFRPVSTDQPQTFDILVAPV